MTAPSTPPPTFAADVTHEVEQLLTLHRLLRQRSHRRRPKAIRSALRTAYAAHFRVLMEFFHDGRPDNADWNRIPSESRTDIKYSRVTGTSKNRFAGCWSKRDLLRLRDADKLLAHLAEGRATRRGSSDEWGGALDWKLLRPKIRDFLGSIRGSEAHYRAAVTAARRVRFA